MPSVLQELFNEIRKDHQEVMTILTRMQETTEGRERQKLIDTLLQEILPHMVAEEQVVYPSLRPDNAAWEDAGSALEQHRKAQAILEELASTNPADERFNMRLSTFRQAVEEHVREEESTIFADLERVNTERVAQNLISSFRKEKDLAKSKYPDLPIRSVSRPEMRI